MKDQSWKTGVALRVDRCPRNCTGERMADDLVHGRRMMKPGTIELEEGWVRNLKTVDPGDDQPCCGKSDRNSDLDSWVRHP